MNNATKTPAKTRSIKAQPVLMVVIGDLKKTNTGLDAINGLFRNPDNSIQNFSVTGPKAVQLSKFRKGSHFKIYGFSVEKTVEAKDGSGSRVVNDIVVRAFALDKAAQDASRAAYKAKLAETAA